MKINKKLVVPFFATVAGLSIAGGLGGAFAWYQFNSQVRTGLIGTSVAQSGVLQIGYKASPSAATVWGSDKFFEDIDLIPVTFGKLGTNNALGATAYGYPEAGQQLDAGYTQGWTVVENGKGYFQYDIYLRALKSNPSAPGVPSEGIPQGFELAAKDVYISDMTLANATANADDKLIADALRVHYSVDGGKKELISKTAITSEHPLDLYGKMDLDGNGELDTYDVDLWDSRYGTEMTYGNNLDTQTTLGIADVKQARDSDGKMPSPANDKRVCVTSDTSSLGTKITITVWLEGWALLKVDNTTNYSNVWNPGMNSGMKVHVGMVFDAGRDILD